MCYCYAHAKIRYIYLLNYNRYDRMYELINNGVDKLIHFYILYNDKIYHYNIVF